MKKKQIIGLGTLLLVLLLGLFTTSYADVNRTWTDTELKNVIYRYYVHYRGINETTVINWIDSHQSNIDILLNKINSSNFVTICNNDGYGLVFLFPASNNPGYYLYNNKLQISNRVTGDIGYYFGWSSLGFNSRTNLNDFSSYRIFYDYLYTSVNISQNGAVTYPAGYYNPSTFFDEWYYESSKSIYFDMQEYAAQQYVDVEFVGDDKLIYNYSDIPLYSLPTKTSEVYFGNLYNEELATLTEDRFAVIYWYNNKWVAKTLDSRLLNTYATSSPYLNVSTNDLIEYSYSQIGRYVVKDCFYFYSIDDSDGNRAVALWYVESSNTVISGDKIDPSTFDNNDNYNNEVQNLIDKIDNIDNIIAGTEPIIDTITNDEDVSGELAAFISGDADDLAAKFGYNPIENPFTTVVLDIVQQLTDVLLGSGNATIDLSNHGINWVINSRDIYLPSGRITTFIHLMCNAWFIWGIYKYGFQLYQWIQSGRLQNLVNETNRHQYFLF